ncbi:MAG: hypothetical protein AB8I08_26095 [Sandaracinaceae bacterium]
MKRRAQIEPRRVLYIGPLGAGIFSACMALPLLAIGYVSGEFEDVSTLFQIAGAFVISCPIGAWLFNLTSPMFGGLSLRLAPPPPPAGDRHAPVRECPRCGAETPRTQSACQKCDHDFDPGARAPDA